MRRRLLHPEDRGRDQAVSVVSQTKKAFLLTLFMNVTIPATAAQPLVPWSRLCLLGQGELGHLLALSSQLLGQESCTRGTGIPITSQPAGHLLWVLPGESPPRGTAEAGGMGAPWRHNIF